MADTFTLAKDEFRDQLVELRQRVIRADDALRCCANQERRLEGEILRIINETIGIVANAEEGAQLGLVSVPGAIGLQTRIISIPATAAGSAVPPLVLGAVILSTGLDLFRLAQTQGALEFGDLISRAIGQSLSRRKSGCYECIKNKVLSQAAPRQRVTTKILRRA